MKVFKISVKFEQDKQWSQREADVEGYLIQQNHEDEVVEGYVKILYPTATETVRYIKGLYFNDSLIYMQLCNNPSLSPVCYCFPNIKENGFWSAFDRKLGFFPCCQGVVCSLGHATIVFEEIADARMEEIAKETAKIFKEKTTGAISISQDLMSEVESLRDFLDENLIFQMNLHCGEW